MKLLTIVPARAGSKGIKNKNFINFLGKPLIEHSLGFAKKIKNNKILISSDYKNIKRYEKKFQTISGYIRPKKLSKDNTLLNQTLNHAVNWVLKRNDIIFDYILILQPTSPIRLFGDFKKILSYTKKKKLKSVCSVVKVKHHPEEYLKKVNKNKWSYLIKPKRAQRQNYGNYYFIDGSFYLIKKNFFIKNKKILTKNSHYFPLSIGYPVDLDDPIDLKIAEAVYKFKNANN